MGVRWTPKERDVWVGHWVDETRHLGAEAARKSVVITPERNDVHRWPGPHGARDEVGLKAGAVDDEPRLELPVGRREAPSFGSGVCRLEAVTRTHRNPDFHQELSQARGKGRVIDDCRRRYVKCPEPGDPGQLVLQLFAGQGSDRLDTVRPGPREVRRGREALGA